MTSARLTGAHVYTWYMYTLKVNAVSNDSAYLTGLSTVTEEKLRFPALPPMSRRFRGFPLFSSNSGRNGRPAASKPSRFLETSRFSTRKLMMAGIAQEKTLFQGHETSPSAISAVLRERPEGLTLPAAVVTNDILPSFALIDMSPKLANRRRKPSKSELQPELQPRKAVRRHAGRFDAILRPASHGPGAAPSAAQVWAQSLAEWRTANPNALSVAAAEFVPAFIGRDTPTAAPTEAGQLDSSAPAFVPTSLTAARKSKGSRRSARSAAKSPC